MTNDDLKQFNMAQLIEMHNERATKLGVSTETTFKSLAAARTAVLTLEKKMTEPEVLPEVATGVTNAAAEAFANSVAAVTGSTGEASDKAKYSSLGKRGPNQGVGSFAKELIAQGLGNAEVLAAVKEKFADAKTTAGCIAYYRTAMSKAPVAVTPEALRAKAEALRTEAAALDTKAAETEQAIAAKAAADAEAAATAAQESTPVNEAAPV